MTDAAFYMVTYQVKKSKVYRTRVYMNDNDFRSLVNTTQITIVSVKILIRAIKIEPGEGMSWVTAVRNWFRVIK